jgi:hypothetical protein
MLSSLPASMNGTSSRTDPVGAAATVLVWPAPWRSFGREIVWWFGSWTGLVDRFRIS